MGDQDFKVPTWVDNEFMLKVLQWKFNRKDIQVDNVSVVVGTNKGDGFACEMFRVAVKSSLGDFKLILKKPHESPERSEIVQGFDMYSREIGFYLKDHSALADILRSVDEYEEFAPEMFYADHATELLILRDLRDDGYKTGDRVNRVSRDHARILLRKLAKMHASSMVLNQRLNGELEKKDYKIFSGDFNCIMINHVLAIIKDMQSWGDEYQSIIPKMEYFVENFKEMNNRNVSSTCGLNVMIHGDPWFNNMLLRAGDDPNVLMIDFQTVSWASLAIDLIYFTITSLNAADFEDREELLSEYHAHLARVLEKLKWQDVPTLADILKEYKAKFLYSIHSSVAKLITASENSGQNLEDFKDEQEDVLLKKVRSPRINQELRNTVKLLDFYGGLDN